jgi:hypothetical protein
VTFTDVPAGASLFIDANTFVYHFSPTPSSARLARNCSTASHGVKLPEARRSSHDVMHHSAYTKQFWPTRILTDSNGKI